jgi:tRNA (mo5U34)-methyltransferase
MPHYRALDQAKIALLREIVGAWKSQLGLKTAWDVGCGVGHYSALLLELGFDTRALDGRADNVEEASRRVPGLTVNVADVEDPELVRFGKADLVFCLGLLYHLENPFRAITNLAQLTGKLMVIESMCTWDELPVMYFREEGSTEDQGLRHIAFYPSESCLAKMLYRAGFSHVYRFTHLPDNADFRASRDQTKRRTMLVASRMEFKSMFLAAMAEPSAQYDPWRTAWANMMQPVKRFGHFIVKPWPEKMATLRRLLGFDGAIKSV